MFEQLGPVHRAVGSPSAAMGRLIAQGGAAIAALDARMGAVGRGLAEVDQRLRAVESLAEQGRSGPARSMALGADL